jgi:hypothetical protein
LKNRQRAHVRQPPHVYRGDTRGTRVAQAARMLRSRSAWLRILQLYHLDDLPPVPGGLLDDVWPEGRVHACSRFQSLDAPGHGALYAVHEAGAAPGLGLGGLRERRRVEHTLAAAREFRRVPMVAASLGLTLFRARPAAAAAVVAALADFVERAVDAYQPAYLLLAHSLEEPRLSLLLTAAADATAGVVHAAALASGPLRDELDAMLDGPPERFVHAPEALPVAVAGAIVPYAV